MLKMNKNKKGQAGFIVTVELLLIVTVLVIGLIAGWAKVRDQVNAELSDAGNAIGSIDNGYGVHGLQWDQNGLVAESAGFAFQDATDVSTNAGDAGGDGGTVTYSALPTSSTTAAAAENNLATF